MVETLDVDGGSILQTHRDPRPPAPWKISLNPPGGFNILKPLGARRGGRERGARARFPATKATRRSACDKNTVSGPNAQQRHTFGQGGIGHLGTECGSLGIEMGAGGGHGTGAPCPRTPGKSCRASLPAAPSIAEGMLLGGTCTGLLCPTHDGCTRATETTVPGIKQIYARFLSALKLLLPSVHQ